MKKTLSYIGIDWGVNGDYAVAVHFCRDHTGRLRVIEAGRIHPVYDRFKNHQQKHMRAFTKLYALRTYYRN